MSTADPTRKMSKSAGEKHYIAVFGDEKRIQKQIRSAVTDTGEATETMSPGVANLFSMLKAAGDMDNYNQLMDTYNDGNLRYGDLKVTVGNTLVELTNTFKANREELNANTNEMKSNKIQLF